MTLIDRIANAESRTALAKAIARAAGFEIVHMVRKVAYDRCHEYIDGLNPPTLDVLEISAGPHWRDKRFRSYSTMDYPAYDICVDTHSDQFDLIIADNVLEHVRSPAAAVRNIHGMLKPGGVFMVLTPFMIRYHRVPTDYWRWTEQGLSYLLADNGFDEDEIECSSWGNARAVKANLKHFRRWGWGLRADRQNDPNFPVTVWAFARRKAQ